MFDLELGGQSALDGAVAAAKQGVGFPDGGIGGKEGEVQAVELDLEVLVAVAGYFDLELLVVVHCDFGQDTVFEPVFFEVVVGEQEAEDQDGCRDQNGQVSGGEPFREVFAPGEDGLDFLLREFPVGVVLPNMCG